MLFSTVATVAALSLVDTVLSQAVHGTGANGKTMGPAAFMWPADRPWSADHDNTAPCGSAAGPANRTNFPLGGSGRVVSFSIADDSYKVALRVAYGDNPTSQDDFEQFKDDITYFEPGHQCFPVPAGPASVKAGDNATFQMEYWSDNETGKRESFYACADVNFVETEAFTVGGACLNVTASEFTSAGAKPTTETKQEPKVDAPTVAESTNAGGLSNAAKGGIAVGAIVGAALISGAIFFLVRRKRTVPKDSEAGPTMAKVASFTSEQTRRN